MCGRFSNAKKIEELARQYNALPTMDDKFSGNYNIAPTDRVPIVIDEADTESRTIELAAFGIPTTIQGKTFPLLNYRSETVTNRADFKYRRCVIPADGFYEWEKITPKEKQPYYFTRSDKGLFSFAGVWRRDNNKLAFTILTTAANDLVGAIHGRMPVILSHNGSGQWLAPDSAKDNLIELLQPYPATLMNGWKVSKSVNNPKYKEALCINSL